MAAATTRAAGGQRGERGRGAGLRIIGVGNRDRGDDAVGPEVVRRLRERGGVEARECAADAASLLEAWRGAGRVVLVDAVRRGAPPGSVLRFDVRRTPLPARLLRGSTHGLGVAEAVELARALGRLPGDLVVIGIEGEDFSVGVHLSPRVGAAVERLVGELLAMVCIESPAGAG